MPRGDKEAAVSDSKVEPQGDKMPSPAPSKKIMMEDPSEYRPELKDMLIGKDQEEFRGFYNVRKRSSKYSPGLHMMLDYMYLSIGRRIMKDTILWHRLIHKCTQNKQLNL